MKRRKLGCLRLLILVSGILRPLKSNNCLSGLLFVRFPPNYVFVFCPVIISSSAMWCNQSIGRRLLSNLTFRVIVAGDGQVGKSSLVQQFSDSPLHDDYNIGIDYHTKVLATEDQFQLKMEVWDSVHQDKTR